MTIKKRLFISNILMVVLPIVISLVTVGFSILVLNGLLGGTLFSYIVESEAMQKEQLSGYANLQTQIVLFGAVMVLAILAVVFITNRLLTKYVFDKVEQPLEMLAHGVAQIGDGNLDYQIEYAEQDEFKPICDSFNQMATALKASIEQVQKNELNRKELLAGISHDLRSPLTSIKAYVEGLLDGVAATPEAQEMYLTTIKNKTDDINRLVAKLFLFSKMDLGEYPYYPEKLNLHTEIHDLIHASETDYGDKGLTFGSIDIPEDLHVFADPTQLRSVFTNIIDNSAKYKEKEAAAFSIRVDREKNLVRIVMEDNGPGVPADALDKLFEVFYRSDASRTNPHKGSGLGLAIVAKAVECMEGSIRAENREGGGLQMVIEIPEYRGDCE